MWLLFLSGSIGDKFSLLLCKSEVHHLSPQSKDPLRGLGVLSQPKENFCTHTKKQSSSTFISEIQLWLPFPSFICFVFRFCYSRSTQRKKTKGVVFEKITLFNKSLKFSALLRNWFAQNYCDKAVRAELLISYALFLELELIFSVRVEACMSVWTCTYHAFTAIAHFYL